MLSALGFEGTDKHRFFITLRGTYFHPLIFFQLSEGLTRSARSSGWLELLDQKLLLVQEGYMSHATIGGR